MTVGRLLTGVAMSWGCAIPFPPELHEKTRIAVGFWLSLSTLVRVDWVPAAPRPN